MFISVHQRGEKPLRGLLTACRLGECQKEKDVHKRKWRRGNNEEEKKGSFDRDYGSFTGI